MQRFQGKNILITGAATGIGRSTAIRFASEGANVGINYFKLPDKAEEAKKLALKQADKNQVKLFDADISKEDEVQNLLTSFISEFGSIDTLVCNAGILIENSESNVNPIGDFDKIIQTNLRGTYLCCDEAINYFLKHKSPGCIINISSVHEVIPNLGSIPYSMSKAGIGNLTKSLALKFADKGIRVNAVGPGAIVTPMNDSWLNDTEERTKIESYIPMQRIGEPEEIASVVAFLASNDASYLTGQTLFVDGGMMIWPEFRHM